MLTSIRGNDIFVVDDSSQVLCAMEQLLQAWGYGVSLFRSGEELMRAVEKTV